jgi:hypothetical protein
VPIPTEKKFIERRAEPRHPASGHIRLRYADYLGASVDGILLDTSEHGFRALHNCPTLASGQNVLFEHSGLKGRARVMWTRIDGDQVQSGFYIVP